MQKLVQSSFLFFVEFFQLAYPAYCLTSTKFYTDKIKPQIPYWKCQGEEENPIQNSRN